MALRQYLRRAPVQNRRRALVKTLCYRVLMVLITIGVAFAVTGDQVQAVNIGLVTNAIKTGTYYVYERIWDRIEWGVRYTAG